MQISETLSQELHKQFTVTYPVSELEKRVTARLEEMKPRINLKGFRPGKAPVSFLKKQFGKSVMGEVVEAAVTEGSQKAISDNKLKPALQPRIEPVGSVEEVVEGKADLTFKVIVDLMPDFTVTDVTKLSVERSLLGIVRVIEVIAPLVYILEKPLAIRASIPSCSSRPRTCKRPSARSRSRTRRAAESCGKSRGACHSARRSRGCSPSRSSCFPGIRLRDARRQ